MNIGIGRNGRRVGVRSILPGLLDLEMPRRREVPNGTGTPKDEARIMVTRPNYIENLIRTSVVADTKSYPVSLYKTSLYMIDMSFTDRLVFDVKS